MTVKEIMRADVATCAPENHLGTAIRIMQEHKCGFVPVVDSHGVVIGVLTNRDACMAVVAKHRTADHIAVRETMSQPVYCCFGEENLKTALVTMGKHHVRRLPVLDKEHGHVEGVLSIDDVLHAPRRRGSPTADDIVDALKTICAPRTFEAVTS